MATRQRSHIEPTALPPDVSGVKEGAFSLRDGKIVIRSSASFESANLPASTASRVRAMMAVSDAVRLVFQTQLEAILPPTVKSPGSPRYIAD